MLGLIGMIIAGAIIGALARLIMRGHQNISALWTVILGAVGAFVGGGIASFFGVAQIPLVSTGFAGSSPLSPPLSQSLYT